MKCTVLGFARLKGKSRKSGNDYDFYTISIAFKGEKGYTGQRVKEISVNPDEVQGIEKLTCPFPADLSVGFDGRVSSISFA